MEYGPVISVNLVLHGISPLVMITSGVCLFILFSWQDLVSNLTPGNPLLTGRLSGYDQYFIAHSATVSEAKGQALKLLDNVVVRQSNLLSFGDAYLLIGMVFLLSLPVLLLAGRKKGQAGAKPHVILSDH